MGLNSSRWVWHRLSRRKCEREGGGRQSRERWEPCLLGRWAGGGHRAAGRLAGGLAGGLGEGRGAFGWAGSQGQDTASDGWLGKRPLGSLPLCLCLLGPPCLSISPCAPPPLAIPAVWSQPAVSHISPSWVPAHHRLQEASALPASLFPCLSLGPASLPTSSSLPRSHLMSVCQRDLSKGWEDSPAACPPGTSAAAAGRGQASLKANGCCLTAPGASAGPPGHHCVRPPPPSSQTPLQETTQGCGVRVFSFWVLSNCPTADVEASRSSGVTVPHSRSDSRRGG